MRLLIDIGLGLSIALILSGCLSSPVPQERPHEFLVPPEGKAAIYFLRDWEKGMRPNFGCYEGPSDRQLIVDNWPFSELRRGQWTYLFVEPVPLQFSYATRLVLTDNSPPNCIYRYDGLFSDPKKIVDLAPNPNRVYFFSETSAGWESVQADSVRSMLDVRTRQCRDCSGRPSEDALQLVKPPGDHYVSPRYERQRCFRDCFNQPYDGPDRCSQNALSGTWDCPQKDHCDEVCSEFGPSQ